MKMSVPCLDCAGHGLESVERLAGGLYGKLFATPTLVLLPHQLHEGVREREERVFSSKEFMGGNPASGTTDACYCHYDCHYVVTTIGTTP